MFLSQVSVNMRRVQKLFIEPPLHETRDLINREVFTLYQIQVFTFLSEGFKAGRDFLETKDLN